MFDPVQRIVDEDSGIRASIASGMRSNVSIHKLKTLSSSKSVSYLSLSLLPRNDSGEIPRYGDLIRVESGSNMRNKKHVWGGHESIRSFLCVAKTQPHMLNIFWVFFGLNIIVEKFLLVI